MKSRLGSNFTGSYKRMSVHDKIVLFDAALLNTKKKKRKRCG